MWTLRTLSMLAVPLLGGCFIFGWGSDRENETQELPNVEYSRGFFTEFDQSVEDASVEDSTRNQAEFLREEFTRFVQEGPCQDETVAVGSTWDKVSIFMEIGLASAEVMETVRGAEQNQVDIFGHAADRVRRSDASAINDWNETVVDMGFSDSTMQTTGELVWESLYLVLTESEEAYEQVWVESSEWVEGYWARDQGYYEQLWVDGYYETLWQEGACYEVYAGTDCSGSYVEDSCYDVWVDGGYWDSYCSAYDDWGYCIAWDEYWVDDGYYETYCDSGYYYEDCYELYDTVCDQGQWVEIWVDGYYVQGAWVPGESYWVEGYWADTSGYQSQLLLEQEYEILAVGIELVLSIGQERVGEACHDGLDEALDESSDAPIENAGQLLRDAILVCLSPH